MCSFFFTFLKHEKLFDARDWDAFSSSSQLSRMAFMHSARRRVSASNDRTPCKREKKGTAYLLRAGRGRWTWSFAQCLQTSVNKRHIATQIASFKFPHTEQASYSSSSAVGKRAIVRPTRCARHNRWMDGGRGQVRVLPSITFGKYRRKCNKYDGTGGLTR